MSRPVYELENVMPAEEILEWRAVWSIEADEEKKRAEKAKQEAKRSGSTRGGRKR